MPRSPAMPRLGYAPAGAAVIAASVRGRADPAEPGSGPPGLHIRHHPAARLPRITESARGHLPRWHKSRPSVIDQLAHATERL